MLCMIHSASPIFAPDVNIIFRKMLVCFTSGLSVDGQTDNMYEDNGSADWIKDSVFTTYEPNVDQNIVCPAKMKNLT